MRETTKTVTFHDFTFRYSRRGQFEDACSITVCEPNFEKRAVHAKMSAMVFDALIKAQQRVARPQSEEAPQVEPAAAAAASDGSDVEVLAGADQAEPDYLIHMQMGMPSSDYSAFLEYARVQLTGDRRLAFVGDDTSGPVKERIPIDEGVWMSLAEEGGMDAVNRVLSAFVSFFHPAARQKRTSGTAKS